MSKKSKTHLECSNFKVKHGTINVDYGETIFVNLSNKKATHIFQFTSGRKEVELRKQVNGKLIKKWESKPYKDKLKRVF